MRFLPRHLVFVLFGLLAFICHVPSSTSKVAVPNILDSSDHIVLSNTRVVIDDAISERQRRGLMDLMQSLPQFQTNNPVMENNGGKRNAKYVYQDINLFNSETRMNVTRVSENSNTHTHFGSALERNLQWMRLLMEVEVQIIEYAEAFFNMSLTKFNSALFYRSHTTLDEPQESHLAKFNNGSGWLVPIHVDDCVFNQEDWKCSNATNEYFRKQFSAVLFLNDLSHGDAGGEFVFLDSTRRRAEGITPAMEAYFEAQRQEPGYNRRKVSTTEYYTEDAGAAYYEHLHASEGTSCFSIPPPSRAQIRRALAQEQRRRRNKNMRRGLGDTPVSENGGKDEEEELVTASTKYSKTVTVSSVGMNYTVVFPRAGRLAIFKSSVENIHAVTQILKENDKRFTLFIFIKTPSKPI